MILPTEVHSLLANAFPDAEIDLADLSESHNDYRVRVVSSTARLAALWTRPFRRLGSLRTARATGSAFATLADITIQVAPDLRSGMGLRCAHYLAARAAKGPIAPSTGHAIRLVPLFVLVEP
jgi:hypothetical protein